MCALGLFPRIFLTSFFLVLLLFHMCLCRSCCSVFDELMIDNEEILLSRILVFCSLHATLYSFARGSS
ncbi:hypothetical protein M758_7G002200 [Ceratodon purpureus]|nr:hypothetical protein M758_7G002200 [Ceratodon purpureus]